MLNNSCILTLICLYIFICSFNINELNKISNMTIEIMSCHAFWLWSIFYVSLISMNRIKWQIWFLSLLFGYRWIKWNVKHNSWNHILYFNLHLLICRHMFPQYQWIKWNDKYDIRPTIRNRILILKLKVYIHVVDKARIIEKNIKKI